MKANNMICIDWDAYRPSADMQVAIDNLNHWSFREVLNRMPGADTYYGKRASFGYRLYSQHKLEVVTKVYVLINGFAERADIPDAGIKGLLADGLLKRTERQKYALLIVSGLVSLPTRERNKIIRRGYGSLDVVAGEVANLVQSKFPSVQAVTVSGYSLGGVLAPLVARAIVKRHFTNVDRVCCGEPNFVKSSITRRLLLQRVAKASAFRNDQIKATALEPYIAIKKTPPSLLAMMSYRARQYRPLLRRIATMRFVARDLALQARFYPQESSFIQLQEALVYLARHGVQLNLLHAEHSLLCEAKAFYQLVDVLMEKYSENVQLVIIQGEKADHGIEEQRSLSTPFLVDPKIYREQRRTDGVTIGSYTQISKRAEKSKAISP